MRFSVANGASVEYPVGVDFSPIQIAMVLVIALLVFGPSRLPEMGRQLGRGIREAKRQMSDLGEEMTRSIDADQATSSGTQVATTTEVSATTSATTTAAVASVSTTADRDADLLDGVLVSGSDPSPGSSADTAPVDAAAPLADDDLLDGIVVSGETPPGPTPEG